MGLLGAVYVAIKGDRKPLEKELRQARRSVVSAVGKMSKRFVKFGIAAGKALAFTGIAGSIASIYALKRAIESVTEAATIQETAETRLDAVLKSTGWTAGLTGKQLRQMASDMQQITTVGDEVILAGQAILLTFKQIKGDEFRRTMMAALDLSEVMGTDLRSSVVMLGKALNDPIANLGALGRAGIQFTKTQKEMIKNLWESGKASETQKIILKELESQFGGTAAAASKTFGGAMKQLSNVWGDFLEEIGFSITKSKTFVAIINDIKASIGGWIAKVREWIKENRTMIELKAGTYYLEIKNAILSVSEKFRGLKRDAGIAAEGVRILIAPFKLLWKVLKTVGKSVGYVMAKIAKFKDSIKSVGKTEVMVDFKGKGSAVRPLSEKINEMSGKFGDLKETMEDPITPMADFHPMRQAIDQMISETQTQLIGLNKAMLEYQLNASNPASFFASDYGRAKSAIARNISIEEGKLARLQSFDGGGWAAGPDSGYPVILHGKERVLTESEGKAYDRGQAGGVTNNFYISGVQNVAQLERELKMRGHRLGLN